MVQYNCLQEFLIAQDQAVIPLVSNFLALGVHVLLGYYMQNAWDMGLEGVGLCTMVHFMARWVFALSLIVFTTDFWPYLVDSWRVTYLARVISQFKFCGKNMFVSLLPLVGSECFVLIAS